MLVRLAVVLIFGSLAAAQNFRVDGVVQSRSGLPAPGALVAVCSQPANTTTTPCTPLAPLCSSVTDTVCNQPNPVTADGLGNYFFYAPPGLYTYQISGSALTTKVLPDQRIGTSSSSSSGGGSSSGTPTTITNCTAAGTTLNQGVQLSTQVVSSVTSLCATTAQANSTSVIGICTSTCGSSGSANVAYSGYANGTVDNQTVQGDYVIPSSTPGQFHDIGTTKPAGTVELFGVVASTNAGGGTTASILVSPLSLYAPGAASGSGTVANATIGKIGFYPATGTGIAGDACTTDGSGNETCNSVSTNGAGTGVLTFLSGTAPSQPVAGKGSFYLDSGTNQLKCLLNGGGSCLASPVAPLLIGSDGVSSPGSMVYLLGSENFSIANNLAAVGTFTGSGSAFIGQSPFAVQSVVNPASNDHLTLYTAMNAIAQTPTALTSTIGIMEGVFAESRYNGSGTIGGNSGDFGLAALDAEAFVENTAVVGSIGGVRGVYGNAGYLGSGASPSGVVSGGEFQFEIGNGSAGSLNQAYGVVIDSPNNSGGTGTTTVSNYSGLQLNCGAASFITNYSCLVVSGTVANNLGGGATSAAQLINTAVSGGSATAPWLAVHNQASHHAGIFDSNNGGQGVLAFAANDTLGMELDFTWGLYLHDGDCIGFGSNTTSLNKDTSLCRPNAAVVAVGDAANGNAVNGVILAQYHAVQIKATAGLTAGQPVKADTSNGNQVVVTTTTDTGAGIAIGFVQNSPGAGGNAYVVTNGELTTPVVGTGTCAIGNWVIVDTTTTGRVKCTGTYPTAGTVLGTAMTAQGSVGSTVTVMVGLK